MIQGWEVVLLILVAYSKLDEGSIAFSHVFMIAFIYYPLYLILFWYKDVLGGLINFFVLLNRYIVSLLSLPLLIRTFFKPLKNEYRDGLVVFSLIFGIFIKTVLIFIAVGITLVALCVECFIGLLVASIPIFLVILILGIGSPLWYAK